MAGKKPWCAEGVCSPAVPMHTKGCARRDMFLKGKALEADPFVQELIKAQKHALDARSGPAMAARAVVPDLVTEPGSLHFSHYLPTPAPVVEKKPWWKRVFGG